MNAPQTADQINRPQTGTTTFQSVNRTVGDQLFELEKDRSDLLSVAKSLVEIVEGFPAIRWADPKGKRLKDTQEWVEFYTTVQRLRE